MEKSITFRPILWRLVVWKFVPIYIGFVLGMWLLSLINGYADYPLLQAAVAGLVVTVIFSMLYRKQYDIVISDGNISGQTVGPLTGRETFPITEVDQSRLHKPTLNEKIFLFRTLHSTTERKILISDFIYGKSAVSELYTMLENKGS